MDKRRVREQRWMMARRIDWVQCRGLRIRRVRMRVAKRSGRRGIVGRVWISRVVVRLMRVMRTWVCGRDL